MTADVRASGGTFVLSSSSLDRDSDRITPDALKGATKSTNRLLCLWQHKRDQPIGTWENLRLEGQKLLGDLKLAATNLGVMVKALLDDDVPLGASIGFMGKGAFNKDGGVDYTDVELLECSIVSIQSNRDAKRIAKQFGMDINTLDIDPNFKADSCLTSEQAILNAKRALARFKLVRRAGK